MVQQGHGPHHFHRRVRIHKKHEKYPHPNKWVRFLDRIIFIVGVLGPLMTLPQVLKIWINGSAVGVSLLSWASYLALDTVWLIYGIVHKYYPIVVAYAIWIILDFAIVIGVLKYGSGFF